MGFPFTFFASKPKALESKPEPSTGSKRHLEESEKMEDDMVPKAKRQRMDESAYKGGQTEPDENEPPVEEPAEDPIETSTDGMHWRYEYLSCATFGMFLA